MKKINPELEKYVGVYIFEDDDDWLKNVDTKNTENTNGNGCSIIFLEKYYDFDIEAWLEDNKTNTFCFNCYNCIKCKKCEMCEECEDCKKCYECEVCKKCVDCWTCVYCGRCKKCGDLYEVFDAIDCVGPIEYDDEDEYYDWED